MQIGKILQIKTKKGGFQMLSKEEMRKSIKTNQNILISELNRYGSFKSRKNKSKNNCCYCDSSDAMKIKKQENGEWTHFCFSCNKGGDVIRLVMDMENLHEDEAIQVLSDRYGLGFSIKNLRYNNTKKIEKVEKEEDKTLWIDSYISEREGDVSYILDQPGLSLMTAPTGAGKTFTVVGQFIEKSRLDEDRVFIILCPNRVQNEQNSQEYNINAIIGGVKSQSFRTVASAVYEKVDEIMSNYYDKKITLVVDEAHQLLESISYRKDAIDKIDVASEKAFNTIHVTATPRKLFSFYQYNNIFEFKFIEKKPNLDYLSIIPSTDIDKTLFSLLDLTMQNNRKALIFLSGSKKDLKVLGESLSKDYRIGTITSEDKKSSLYRAIVENSMIPDDYDVVLATKVLECGTNIKNTNITAIEVVKTINHFDLDSVEQKFARLRNFNQNAYIIVPQQDKENVEIRTFEDIKKDIEYAINNSIKGLKALEKAKKTAVYDLSFAIEQALNLSINALTGASGSLIDFDEDENKKYHFSVNEKKLVNKSYKEYDKQFLYNLETLKKELEQRIKANTIEILFDVAMPEADEFKEELKQNRKIAKKIKEELSDQARNIIKDLSENVLFFEYLNSQSKFEMKEYIKRIDKNTYNKILFLEGEEKELEKLKELNKLDIYDLQDLTEVYLNLDSLAAVKRYTKHHNYKLFNRVLINVQIPTMYSSYSILRKKFDVEKNKKKRITQKDIFSVVGELNDKKLLWQFDCQRIKQDFEQMKVETDKKKRQKLVDRVVKKTIDELKLIYNVTKDDKGYIITSLL